MKLVDSNSAHYAWQQQYLNYIKSLKPGDTVYPGYDGKGGRCTACKVAYIVDNRLFIEGNFWVSDKEFVTYEFDVNTGESVDENQDFYQLVMWEGYDVSDGYFSDNYLKSLGLK